MMISLFDKILSYIAPVAIHSEKSPVSKSLNVVLYNGRLLLDTPHTNYSYGSLQRVLRQGLDTIGFAKIRAMRHILVLGLAGGSVVKILVDEIGYKQPITAVDIDPQVVELAKRYFLVETITNLQIVIDDAERFVKHVLTAYDLIIIDIFQDDVMPDFLFTEAFADNVLSRLAPNGSILFNTMVANQQQQKRNLQFVEYCGRTHHVTIIPNVEQYNELLIVSNTLHR